MRVKQVKTSFLCFCRADYEKQVVATLPVIEVDDFSVSLRTPSIQEREGTSHRESRGQTRPSFHSPAFLHFIAVAMVTLAKRLMIGDQPPKRDITVAKL
ncbi:unnamed protein product [Larinioides sclopetarius]|uniref:Uncharacterized protein n=1 Tax=Larinioides sclopetarius TaxID=280406 RepID=A0AAV1ZWK0_9ARAC